MNYNDGTSLNFPLRVHRNKEGAYTQYELWDIEEDAIRYSLASKNFELTSLSWLKRYTNSSDRLVDVFDIWFNDKQAGSEKKSWFYVDVTDCKPERAVIRNTEAEKPCSYCGRPSIPGEETCYFHHQK